VGQAPKQPNRLNEAASIAQVAIAWLCLKTRRAVIVGHGSARQSALLINFSAFLRCPPAKIKGIFESFALPT